MSTQGEWECGACGYLHDGESAPPMCPDCAAPASRFIFYVFYDDSEWDEELAFMDTIPYEEYDIPLPT